MAGQDIDPSVVTLGVPVEKAALRTQLETIKASIVALEAGGVGGSPGVTDHGELLGLADDDHPQYHTDDRALAWFNGVTVELSQLPDSIDDRVVLGRALDAGPGIWTELTEVQLRDIVGIAGATNRGLVPSTGGSSGRFLMDDLTWVTVSPSDATSLRGVTLDPTVGSPTDGKILVYRDASVGYVLEDKPVSGNPNLDDILNVTAPTPADNDVLAWDTATSQWINQAATAAGLATALQGGKADTALQPANIASGTITPHAGALNLSGGTTGQVLTKQSTGVSQFAAIGSHTHTKSQISDFPIQSVDIADGAVTPIKLEDTAVTPGPYTNVNATVDQQGRVTAISSGTAGAGGLTTVNDAGTAILIATGLNNTHRRLTAGTAITLTLDAQAPIQTKVAVTPKGAGVVSVVVEAGATYKLPLDTAGRTTGFVVNGYVLFECVGNSGGSAAEWDVVGNTNHSDLLDNAIVGAGQVVSDVELKDIAETYVDAGNKSGAASFDFSAGAWQKCVATGNITAVSITNPPAAGKSASITLEIHQDGTGGRTVVWGSAFRFPGGTDLTLSAAAAAIDIFGFSTRDGGTTWYAFEGGKAFAA